MNINERRNTRRFQTKKPTFVAMRPDFSRLGKLLDVSMEGLSFQYMSRGMDENVSSSIEIDIFINGEDFYIQGVNCKIVHDTGFQEGTALPEGLEHRRCGVQFRNLSKMQSNMLTRYLAENGVERLENEN